MSLITAEQAGGTGAGGEHGQIEMLWTRAENGIATGGAERPSGAGEKHGMALCNRDTPGQFVSLRYFLIVQLE